MKVQQHSSKLVVFN